MTQTTSKDIVSNVRKTAEFRAFLNVVDKGEIPDTWELLAEALGVRPATISDWKKLPEFQIALAEGIKRTLKQMETVGKRDWRQWKERASLLTREANKQQPQQQLNVQGDLVVQIANMTDDQINQRLGELRGNALTGGEEPSPVQE